MNVGVGMCVDAGVGVAMGVGVGVAVGVAPDSGLKPTGRADM